jgi:hypothetical protein
VSRNCAGGTTNKSTEEEWTRIARPRRHLYRAPRILAAPVELSLILRRLNGPDAGPAE